jgi:hypothetical protein
MSEVNVNQIVDAIFEVAGNAASIDALKDSSKSKGDIVLDACKAEANIPMLFAQVYKTLGWKGVIPTTKEGDALSIVGKSAKDLQGDEKKANVTLGQYRSHVLKYWFREGNLDVATMGELREANKQADSNPLDEQISDLLGQLKKASKKQSQAWKREYIEVLKMQLNKED